MSFNQTLKPSINIIEFDSIIDGLHGTHTNIIRTKASNQETRFIPKPSVSPKFSTARLIRPKKKENFFFQRTINFESEAKKFAVQLRTHHQKELSLEIEKTQRYRPLTSQPAAKIPAIPITLMNSSMKNKKIQMLMLLQQKSIVNQQMQQMKGKTVSSSYEPGLLQQQKSRAEQEQAVKELLSGYGTQISGHASAKNFKKRKIVNEVKEKYMRELFIKNRSFASVMQSETKNKKEDREQQRYAKGLPSNIEISIDSFKEQNLKRTFQAPTPITSQQSKKKCQCKSKVVLTNAFFEIIDEKCPIKGSFCKHLLDIRKNKTQQTKSGSNQIIDISI